MRLVIVIACGLCVAAPALARKQDSVDASKDPNKVVCKIEDVTGSRLQTQKECMTVAQWDQLRREQSGMMDKMQGGSGSQGH